MAGRRRLASQQMIICRGVMTHARQDGGEECPSSRPLPPLQNGARAMRGAAASCVCPRRNRDGLSGKALN
eukprot:355232-Chlamydomonas_euryale.AAC.8